MIPSKKLRKKLPLGYHKAYEKRIRFIKRLEKGVEVVRIETTYYVENFGDIIHYSAPINHTEFTNALL